jgi:integrase
MASIRKLDTGFRAEVARKGVRMSQVFRTTTEAKDWAARQEYLILHQDEVRSKVTFGEVITRYAKEVSPTKRGMRWEQVRLEKFQTYPLAKIPLMDLKASDLGNWRESRLKEVSPSSVKREMVLMSAVLTQAKKEWGLIRESPMADVRKRSDAAPRDRRPSTEEMERLLLSAGSDLTKSTARVYHAFLFAIETAMRAGEVVGLTWSRIDLKNQVAHLPLTKNGKVREVALSSEADRLLEALPKQDPVFGLAGAQLDALWRKLRDRAGVEDLHFHDSRHEAITRLARKLDVLLYQRPFQLTCAQAREVMEAMVFGSLAKKFHAVQQALTMSS